MAKKILLVEDEALIALSESQQLKKHGFDVDVAHTGEKALEAVASAGDISLVLMDIDLGTGIDGTETARRILQIRELPIIFLTSHSEKEYVDRVEKISGYGYVLKNSGEFVLVQSIRMAYKLFGAYRAMKESEEKYRAAFMTSPDSVNINRIDGLYVDINEGFTALTGYSREDVIGKLSGEIDIWAIPEDRERLVDGLESNGSVKNLESRFRCKDGTIKTALMSARVIMLKGEQHILSVTRDTTKKKEVEEWRDMFRQMFMQHSAAQLLVDPNQDGRIIEANQAAVEFYGYSRDQLLSMSIGDINTLPASEIKDYMHAAHTRARERFEFTHRLADGSTREVEVHSSPIRHEDRSVLYSIIRDVSDRVRAEKELTESISRYHELETRIPVGVYIVWIRVNGEKTFEYVSYRWCKLHGVSKEEVMADSAVVDNLVYPDDREDFLERNRKAAEQNKPFCWEGRFFTGTGDVRWFRVESTPRAYDNGDIRFFGVTQDITERKQAEEKYRSLFNYSNDAIFVHKIGDDGVPRPRVFPRRDTVDFRALPGGTSVG